jgi:polyphenol oxidase
MPPSNLTPSIADTPPALTAWEIPGLVHGFGGRLGGVSTGPFTSFNLAASVGDEAVAENWRRWGLLHPNLRVARLSQVHGKLVRQVDATHFGARREVEGMVTATPGLALCIFTADCVPILMVDAERRVAGALHAGWRGTLAGIVGEGVRAMVASGARLSAIRAALGPSIGLCCFEVDAGLAENFASQVAGSSRHTRAGKPGKAYLDLRAILRDQLEREGLEAESITNVGPCTRCANDRYFSRRANGGATSGLQMTFVAFTA